MKRGCGLAPTLFSIFFSIMLKQVIEDLTRTVLYTSATVLTAVCLTSGECMPTLEQLFHDILVADTERALQHLTSCFAEAAQLFGLEVGLKKTEVLHQPAPHITISGTELKEVHHFTYLECTITSDAKIDREVDNIRAKANSAFGRLYKRVWNNNHQKKGT